MANKYSPEEYESLPDDGVKMQRQYIGTSHEVTVKDSIHTHYGLGETETVIRITADDGTQVIGGRFIRKRGRFTIETRWRNALGVEAGDYVDVEILDVFRDNPDWNDVER